MLHSCPYPAAWRHSASPRRVCQHLDSMTPHLSRYCCLETVIYIQICQPGVNKAINCVKKGIPQEYLVILQILSGWLKRPLFDRLKKTEIFRTYFSNAIWVFVCLFLVKHPWWLQSPEPLQTFWGGSVWGSRPRSLQPAPFFGTKHLQGRECEALQETGSHMY